MTLTTPRAFHGATLPAGTLIVERRYEPHLTSVDDCGQVHGDFVGVGKPQDWHIQKIGLRTALSLCGERVPGDSLVEVSELFADTYLASVHNGQLVRTVRKPNGYIRYYPGTRTSHGARIAANTKVTVDCARSTLTAATLGAPMTVGTHKIPKGSRVTWYPGGKAIGKAVVSGPLTIAGVTLPKSLSATVVFDPAGKVSRIMSDDRRRVRVGKHRCRLTIPGLKFDGHGQAITKYSVSPVPPANGQVSPRCTP